MKELIPATIKKSEKNKFLKSEEARLKDVRCEMVLVKESDGNYVRYRVRKLTPKECGRLMGVSDEDIEKMQQSNSNSELYRQFGDSIVVDVMCAMFRRLNIRGAR